MLIDSVVVTHTLIYKGVCLYLHYTRIHVHRRVINKNGSVKQSFVLLLLALLLLCCFLK